MTTKYLLMWFEAPLQSWGFDSKFSNRDTLNFPTKSGILGLLCCASGRGGEQKEFLSEMAPLKTTVVAFSREKGSLLPKMRDFHMVGSGYNKELPFEEFMIPKKSDGKPANGGTKLTYRYYLQDAYFAVVVEIPVFLSSELTVALQNPVWDLYLGRKNCVPTDIIYRGIYSSEEGATKHAVEIAVEKELNEEFRVLDGRLNGENLLLNDVPLQFGERKKYIQRYVTIIPS